MCGVWFWITDHATVLSTVATGVATAAIAWFTVKLADINRNQLEHNQRVERAHVYVKSISCSPRVDPNGNIMAWRIVPIWSNSGATPTKYALTHTSTINIPNQLPDNFDFPDYWVPGEPEENIPISIGPSAEIWNPIQEFHLVDISRVRERRQFIYIWGWIDYNDIFNNTERHRTEFCYEVIVLGDPTDANAVNMSFRPYRRHNGTDHECLKKPAPYSKT